MTTALFTAMNETEAAYEDDLSNKDKAIAADKARAAYLDALAEARALWSIHSGHEKSDSAATNANETVGTRDDQLYWYEIANASMAD